MTAIHLAGEWGELFRGVWAMTAVAFLLCACTLRRPQVTLTLAPIETGTAKATAFPELATATGILTVSPTLSATVALSPTATDSSTPTGAPTATDASTEAPTVTDEPTATASATDAPTATDLPTASDVPTATDSPTATHSPTPAPSATASATEPPAPTRFLPESPSPSPTATPLDSVPQRSDDDAAPTAAIDSAPSPVSTFTPMPTLDDTAVAKLLAPRPTLPATWTPVPTETQVPATSPAFLLATETFAADNRANQRSLDLTIAPSTPAQRIDPTATPTPLQPTVAVRSDLLRPVIEPLVIQRDPITISRPEAYEFNVGPSQNFTFEDIRLGDGVRLFLPNPVDPDSFVRTDDKGMPRFKPLGAASEMELVYSPYFAGFAGGISSIEENKNRIAELDWSADGRQFSFRIDPPPGLDTANAGVWFWQPVTDPTHGTTFQIIRDCAEPGYGPCGMVNPNPDGPWHWKTIAVEWSPRRGSNRLLLTLELPGEGRNGLSIAEARPDPGYANNAPPVYRYDYGHWHVDGSGVTVSGRRPDGRVIIGVVNGDLQGERVILDGSARGLWLRDAVRLPDGEYRALGRPGGAGSGPVALYDGNGNQLSGFVGNAAPEAVRWMPDRGAVVVAAGGRQYTLTVAGSALSDSTDLLSNPSFGPAPAAVDPIPDAVVLGAEYYPGQQLRVVIPVLNVRQSPSVSAPRVGQLRAGDYVAIFAGPYENEGYRWWRTQTAANVFGWVAGTINNAPTLRSI